MGVGSVCRKYINSVALLGSTPALFVLALLLSGCFSASPTWKSLNGSSTTSFATSVSMGLEKGIAWIGGHGQFGFWDVGTQQFPGPNDSQFAPITGGTFKAGSYIYVADTGNNRIQRFDASGAFAGWIGKILASPKGGDPGCEGAVGFTPGWCLGGTATAGSTYGAMSGPTDVWVNLSAGYLYVVDNGNHRINRYTLEGALAGWTGRIGASAGTCGGTGSVTGSWCSDATMDSQAGFLGGGFNNPLGITGNPSGELYITDANQRVVHLSTGGAFLEWVGRLGASPGSCGGANTVLAGWCTDATANSSSGNMDGAFNGPQRLVFSNTMLYVIDGGNNRVQKFAGGTGAFAGSMGRVGAPAGTCSNGFNFNPWCTGGTFAPDPGGATPIDGSLAGANGISSDGTYLYVSEGTYSRVSKYDQTSGTFVGWIGRISNVISIGGGAGCSVAAVNDFTPSWCTGGRSSFSNNLGHMNGPTGIFVDASDGKIYVMDKNNVRLNRYSIAGAPMGALGNNLAAKPAWSSTGTTAAPSMQDGVMNMPQSMALDGAYIYVTDATNNRVVRFEQGSGAFAGWIGRIQVVPPSGGCSSAAVNDPAPVWCFGGLSQTGSTNGAFNFPTGIAVGGGYLYVSDSGNHRIHKFIASTGAYVGSLGNLNGASSGSCPTSGFSGWCTGGTPLSGAATDGSLITPMGIALDTGSDFMFVVNSGNHRIDRYQLSSGAHLGWIGRIGSTAPALSAGCTGQLAGEVTLGWCTGGTSNATVGGAVDGSFSNPEGISTDGPILYIADTNNHRLSRYNAATGAWLGTIGKLGSTGATCTLTVNNPWCYDGTSAAGAATTNGALNTPRQLSVSAAEGALYVADTVNNRIAMFDLVTGFVRGYLGVATILPTGGDPGCDTMMLGELTPGFCLGGTISNLGNFLGAMSNPRGVVASPDGLYVVDTNNQRISRYRR